MEQTRYVQHISKTGPIEEVLSDSGDNLWGYWIVKRTHQSGFFCEAMLWKQDYVLVEKPKEWRDVTSRVHVSPDGTTLRIDDYNGQALHIVGCGNGFRFRKTPGSLQIEQLL